MHFKYDSMYIKNGLEVDCNTLYMHVDLKYTI